MAIHKRSLHRFIPLAMLLTFFALVALPAIAAQSRWQKVESRCMKAFKQPAKAAADKLESCADTWSVYSRSRYNSSREKRIVRKALRFVYESGTDRAAGIARDGLFRLGVRLGVRKERKSVAQASAVMQSTGRKRYNPPAASRSNKKACEKLAKAGIRDLKKSKFKQGTKKLAAAVKKDPRSAFALYNHACGLALLKRGESAIDELQKLADLGGDEHLERLIRARRDGDFAAIRNKKRFKAVTGYTKIKVINTIGKPGKKAVANIETMLSKLGHARPELDAGGDKRESPEIAFKPHAKAQVLLIADLLNHPRVRMKQMTGKSEFDLIIRWGAKVIKDDDGVRVESLGPSTVDDKVVAARKKQNKILAKPDAAIDKVDNVISAPENAYNSVTGGVESASRRVGTTVKKAEGTFQKIKDIGGKISSL